MKKSKKNPLKDTIEILSEREVKYVEMDIEIPEDIQEKLIEYAKGNIAHDTDALLNWAFLDALKRGIER